MGETELEEAPAVGASRRRAPDGGVRASWRAHELKVQARGMSFAEGQRLLTPVQMERDPKGKAERDDAQDERLRELEGRVEAERAARIAQTEASIVAAIARSRLWMDGADDALARMEGAIEEMLVDDARRDAARGGVDASLKAYNEEQKPGLLEGLGMLLSLTDTFKSALGLLKGFTVMPGIERNAVAPGFIAKGPWPPVDPGAIAGPGLDASTSALGAVEKVKGIGGGADATSGMAQALKGYVDSVQGSVGTLQGYVLGRDMAAVGQAYKNALLDHDEALELTAGLGAPLSFGAIDKLGTLTDELDRMAEVIRDRTKAIERLVRARGPQADLAKGSSGRTVFDLVAAKPSAFRLHLEQELRVDVQSETAFSEVQRPVRYWIESDDPDLLARIDVRVRLPGALFKPGFVHDLMRPLPEDAGTPVATLLDTTRHEHESARLVGPDGQELSVHRSQWEDAGQRDRLLWRVIPVERWEDGASAP